VVYARWRCLGFRARRRSLRTRLLRIFHNGFNNRGILVSTAAGNAVDWLILEKPHKSDYERGLQFPINFKLALIHSIFELLDPNGRHAIFRGHPVLITQHRIV